MTSITQVLLQVVCQRGASSNSLQRRRDCWTYQQPSCPVAGSARMWAISSACETKKGRENQVASELQTTGTDKRVPQSSRVANLGGEARPEAVPRQWKRNYALDKPCSVALEVAGSRGKRREAKQFNGQV